MSCDRIRQSYDAVVDEYVPRIYDELEGKPLDRELLARFARTVPAGGSICDLGCGPGHVARHLGELGAHVIGVDLSAGMIKRAEDLNPGIRFIRGDMLALSELGMRFDGIVSFYSIVNFEPARLPEAFGEMRRSLTPEGRLLLAFHLGEGSVHLDEWWGRPVEIDFHFFCLDQVKEALMAAGFEVDEAIERDPYPEVEHQSRRAYLFCSSRPRDSA